MSRTVDSVNRSTLTNTLLCNRQRKSKDVPPGYVLLFFFFLLFLVFVLLWNLITQYHVTDKCLICYSALATFWILNLDHWAATLSSKKKKQTKKSNKKRRTCRKTRPDEMPSSLNCTCNMSGHLGASASALQTPACTSTSSQKKKEKKTIQWNKTSTF